MQSESPVIEQVVGPAGNGRPTVVDFYAEWCENCKEVGTEVLASVYMGRWGDSVD